MVLGAVAAIGQTNIKRLMAYSSIGHMGYALIGLAAGTHAGVQGVLIYLAIYLVTNIGVFVCILAMRRGEHDGGNHRRSRRPGAQRDPALAFAFAMLMFSLAGLPPLAGFFAKFYVFLAAIKAGLYPLAVIGVLASVIGAYLLSAHREDDVFRRTGARLRARHGYRPRHHSLRCYGIFTLFFLLGGVAA